ncbi:MAG: carboxypeptidase regulatory-like domain-containing protein [Acidobacteria bacterium]|nr:carboxypeptidase regulatory-like domain-containing protein [Acidobacteriota bacterium]
MSTHRISKILFAVVICVAFDATAFGQTAQITGRISDQGGAVIQNAKVTVTNEGNGFKRETSSNDEGYFTVPSLLPGSYQVSIQKEGFKPILRTGLVLQVEQVARLDFTLQAGTVTDTVEVQSGAVALDSETASIGQIVSQRQVTQLPLNSRNFLSLLFLNGGTVETGGEQGTMRQGAGSAISINGARPTSNNYLLDGTSNTDTALGTPAAILSIDAIQEFKEQTGTYSAEYGFSANQVNIVSKTGTNDLHGSVFWFGRNDAFDANNFFNNARGVEKTKLRQNQYGFVAGGPVWIPKLYNGRNKSFWLANFEGYKRTLGASDLFTIPTPDQLAGRFTTEIIDPVTGRPFPNNTIPQNRFSRVARLAVAKFFPAPNFTGASGNYLRNRNLPLDQNQYTIRGDQQLGRFGSVYGRFTNSDYTNTSTGNTTELGDRFFIQKTRNWQVSHTMPFSASLVNQFRLGYVEARADENGPAAPQSDIDALQLTGVFTGIPDVQRTYPAVGFAGVGAGLSGGGSAVNDYTTSFQPMWDISNTTTWIRGNHTLNFGANFRKWSLQRDLANDFLGQFTYSGFFTGNSTRDHAIADFLLGYFSGASVFQPAGFGVEGKVGNPRQFNFWYLAPYIQDDWKVTSRLTLNLGVRYDFRTIPFESNDRMGWRDLSNPRGGLLVADKKLVETGIVGDQSYYRFAGRRNPADASKRVFAPRFGFAFRPFNDDKTVVRGGYGVFFDSAEGREIDGAADIFPYVSRGNYTQSLGQPNLITTDSLFPNFASAKVATPAANTFLAVNISPEPRNPYVQQWSLGVQRSLTQNTTLELNYIGSKGTHLLMRRNIAQARPPANPAICAATPTAGDCPVASRKPFTNFGTYIDSDWSGNSSYNAFNAKVEHRSNSMLFTMVYTWAKSIDNKSAAAGIGNDVAGWQGFLNNADIRRDRGRSEFDVDHRLVSSLVYELPIGRGKKFGGNLPKAVDLVIGGWQVNAIATFQRGFPLTISAADVGGLNDTFNTNRADLVGSPKLLKSIDQWFDTSAFKQPAAGFLGTSGRGILRLPGINNWDTGLFKNFLITEKVSFQFRFESFNAFNHTQWGGVNAPVNAPVRNVADPNFGRILSARDARINQLGAKIIF